MVLLSCGVLRAVLGMRTVSDLDVVETLARINASCAHCNFRRMLTLTCVVRCVLHVANLLCAHAHAPDPIEFCRKASALAAIRRAPRCFGMHRCHIAM